jgi:hypothetical protein
MSRTTWIALQVAVVVAGIWFGVWVFRALT